MNLAILHHHLNRGGVTSVVANHLRSLATLPVGDRPERVVVLYDGQHEGWPSDLPAAPAAELIVTPALGYDAAGAAADPERLAGVLRDTLTAAGLSADDTLLHTHNHALGKNASLPGALRRLAADGWRMLLQVHDFAEDNRPENYGHLRAALGQDDPGELGSTLYPQGPGVHYATLTERDADVLRTAGFVEERLHPLPNPVAAFDAMPTAEAARARVLPALGLPAAEAEGAPRLVVYPVRGIRRKNLGEMLLLSALAPAGTWFAVTLAPKNPIERGSFDRWARLADELELPCRFDTGGRYGVDFQDALAAADAILTTSVAEGFGMVFLEAWLAGRPLVGRDLPEITHEFRTAGLTLDGLFAKVNVPRELLDFPEMIEALAQEAADTNRLAYGVEPAERDEPTERGEPDQQAAPAEQGGPDASGDAPPATPVDFGRLTIEDQVEVLRHAAADPSALIAANAELVERLAAPRERFAGPIEANAAAVARAYSLEVLGQRLRVAYDAVFAGEGPSDRPTDGPSPAIDGAGLLEHYLAVERVWPVRVEAPEEEPAYESEDVLEPLSAAAAYAWYAPYDTASVVMDLQQRLHAICPPIGPEPTGETPVLPRLDGIRAVVFDVYGTLLVSGSGDISLASEGSRGAAAAEALAATGVVGPDGRPLDGDGVVAALHAAVKRSHAASLSAHPEVEIRDVWRETLGGLGVELATREVERLAVEYECRVNPIGPMPGFLGLFRGLADREMALGIVSNAQFFTPLAFLPLCGLRLEDLGFYDPELQFWSYEHGEAKPGTFLYERCAEALAEYEIAPGETLYVGNDLRNDVWPAQKVGFKTALFAGDARSLRWRRDDQRLADVRPDVVVTELEQLLGVVGGG